MREFLFCQLNYSSLQDAERSQGFYFLPPTAQIHEGLMGFALFYSLRL